MVSVIIFNIALQVLVQAPQLGVFLSQGFQLHVGSSQLGLMCSQLLSKFGLCKQQDAGRREVQHASIGFCACGGTPMCIPFVCAAVAACLHAGWRLHA